MRSYLRRETDWSITWGEAVRIPKESNVVLIDAPLFLDLKMRNDSMLHDKTLIVNGETSQLQSSFSLGCDDYLKRPWSVEEAHFRILRFDKERFSFTTHGGVQISLSNNLLVCGNNRIPVTPTESRVLKILIRHKNSIVAPHMLYHVVTNRADSVVENEIRVHIHNIRKKLERLSSIQTGKDIIVTIPQEGYCLHSN